MNINYNNSLASTSSLLNSLTTQNTLFNSNKISTSKYYSNWDDCYAVSSYENINGLTYARSEEEYMKDEFLDLSETLNNAISCKKISFENYEHIKKYTLNLQKTTSDEKIQIQLLKTSSGLNIVKNKLNSFSLEDVFNFSECMPTFIVLLKKTINLKEFEKYKNEILSNKIYLLSIVLNEKNEEKIAREIINSSEEQYKGLFINSFIFSHSTISDEFLNEFLKYIDFQAWQYQPRKYNPKTIEIFRNSEDKTFKNNTIKNLYLNSEDINLILKEDKRNWESVFRSIGANGERMKIEKEIIKKISKSVLKSLGSLTNNKFGECYLPYFYFIMNSETMIPLCEKILINETDEDMEVIIPAMSLSMIQDGEKIPQEFFLNYSQYILGNSKLIAAIKKFYPDYSEILLLIELK